MKARLTFAEIAEFFGTDANEIMSIHLDGSKTPVTFEVAIRARDENGQVVKDHHGTSVKHTMRIAVVKE